MFQNAQQRYLDFIINNHRLFNRVSLTDLASFLGIERKSLSRIRKTLSQKSTKRKQKMLLKYLSVKVKVYRTKV